MKHSNDSLQRYGVVSIDRLSGKEGETTKNKEKGPYQHNFYLIGLMGHDNVGTY